LAIEKSEILRSLESGRDKSRTPRVHLDRPSVWDACQKSAESQDIQHREIEVPEVEGVGHHKSRNPDEIRAARLWGRVAEIQAIGESHDEEAVHHSLAHRDIEDPDDKLSVPFGIAKHEIPMSGG
jgi:hypothetical protein